jgi:hypothetical protein
MSMECKCEMHSSACGSDYPYCCKSCFRIESKPEINGSEEWEQEYRQTHGVCELCTNYMTCPALDKEISFIRELLAKERERILQDVSSELNAITKDIDSHMLKGIVIPYREAMVALKRVESLRK